MRILLGHVDYDHPTSIKEWYDAWLGRLRTAGIAVEGFCLTLDRKKPLLAWPELDMLWRTGNKQLFGMYEVLAKRLESYDVFVNFNGINLHPDFVSQLRTFNVYGCFDDPENSENLSRPVAAAYDLAMVGNIAEVETYRAWGVKEVRHWPLGFRADDYDPSLTREEILTGSREVTISLLCERETPYRQARVDRFAAAFPDGSYYGKGWPKGFLPEEERVPLYQRTRIGINIHNSTGPINFRTYSLPANGVMQICDNKSHLGQIYQLDKEVIGFDTTEEAIGLCQYYLAHDDERRQIAAAGWERALRDYNEVSVFKTMLKAVEELSDSAPERKQDPVTFLRRHRRRVTFKKRLFSLKSYAARIDPTIQYVRAATGRRWRMIKAKARAITKGTAAE